ncbi:F-box protein CPR1-like [Quercus lobata]|uniref:F-box domain-containing protein n=1 Tax=Quercus lobata TaxID=97700 RepID=A0A7N2MAL3_QUELO|nr:F-box protein CPR1-like [Quercus lobata]
MSDKEPMWDSLPPGILTHAFLQLPIKSIITCTCVSKKWKSLIQNPSFISTHLHHSSSNSNNHLFLFRLCPNEGTMWDKREREVYTLYSDNNNNNEEEDFNEHTRFDSPFPAQSGSVILRVVGTCNGLVCLARDLLSYDNSYILWNPCVRKFTRTSRPIVSYSTHGGFEETTGFGFDSKTNDYKVVRVVRLLDREDEDGSSLKVEVYSLATDEWRMVTTGLPSRCVVRGREPLAFVNGALHWIAFRRTITNNLQSFVMVFHLGDEVIREIALPEFLNGFDGDQYWVRMSISVYRNSLALFHQQDFSSPCLNIWVMKEYADESSWTKLVTLSDGQCSREYVPRALGFRRSGEVIIEMHDGALISLHFESQKLKVLGITGYGYIFDHSINGNGYTFFDSYVESLVLLDEPNRAVTY